MNNIIVRPISSLKLTALRRAPGYLDECVRVGKVVGDLIEFTPEQFSALRRKYNPNHFPIQQPTPENKELWGDKLHTKLGPIGQAIGWPCLQPGTTNLIPGSPCDKARKVINTVGEKISNIIKP